MQTNNAPDLAVDRWPYDPRFRSVFEQAAENSGVRIHLVDGQVPAILGNEMTQVLFLSVECPQDTGKLHKFWQEKARLGKELEAFNA